MRDIIKEPYSSMMPLAKTICRLRKQEKLTQKALAELAVNVARQDVSEMENARFSGSILKVAAVLTALRYRLNAQAYQFPTIDELDELLKDD